MIIFLIIFLILLSIVSIGYIYASKIEYKSFEKDLSQKKSTNIKVLLITNSVKNSGGGGTHIINLYQNLLKTNINSYILVVKNSDIETKLTKLKLPYYNYKKIIIRKNTFQPGLYKGMYKICKNNKVNLINCHAEKEVRIATKVAKKLNIKVIFNHMSHKEIRLKYLPYISKNNPLKGIIYMSPQMAKLHTKNNNLNNIKNFKFIPPIFNETFFLNFKTNQNKKDFFKRKFNHEMQDLPIICMVAHMYKDETHKNHPLVIQAIQKLILKNNPVQIVFAGSGARKSELKLIAEKLNVKEYVHFLGATNKIPEIIYHSDINLLASKNEAFGIVLLEGALLKKPLICATKTGAENTIIKNQKTGLLFENNNVDSLVEQIEKLLNNAQLCKTLGQNAYKHAKEKFSTNIITNKMISFYKKVLQN